MWFFYIASRFLINLLKSILIGDEVSLSHVVEVAIMIRCGANSLPFIHLGIPVGKDMSQISAWSPVLEHFQSKLC